MGSLLFLWRFGQINGIFPRGLRKSLTEQEGYETEGYGLEATVSVKQRRKRVAIEASWK